jgi:ribosomal protein S18 acetylase RimI-like enzyme
MNAWRRLVPFLRKAAPATGAATGNEAVPAGDDDANGSGSGDGMRERGSVAGMTGAGSTPWLNGTHSNRPVVETDHLEPPPTGSALQSVNGVRGLPRPALRWVGAAGRIALRAFDFVADSDAVCSFQRETYSINFPDFRYTDSFANAFRHDLRRASLDPHHGLFVLDEGRIAGFLWLVICENTWTGERYGYVNNLYVAPQHRSGGLAGELMKQADTWFKSRRINRVRLTVTVANLAACKLYERCGYSVTRWEMEKTL